MKMQPRDKQGRFLSYDETNRKKYSAVEVNELIRAAHIAGQNETRSIFSSLSKKAEIYLSQKGVK
jgi:hypothetical protein